MVWFVTELKKTLLLSPGSVRNEMLYLCTHVNEDYPLTYPVSPPLATDGEFALYGMVEYGTRPFCFMVYAERAH